MLRFKVQYSRFMNALALAIRQTVFRRDIDLPTAAFAQAIQDSVVKNKKQGQ